MGFFYFAGFNFYLMVFSSDFSIFDRQDACTLFKQFCKATGCGVTDHLCNLSHSKIRVDEQMFCLTHTPPLDILCDGATGVPFETGLQFAFAHAGNACKTRKRNIKGIMVGDVADYIFKSFNIFLRQRVCIFCHLFFLIVHYKGNRFRDLCLVEKCSGNPIAAIVFNLKQQLGHGGKVCYLIDALKCGGKVKVFVRILLFQIILIICRENFNSDRVYWNALMNNRLVVLFAADNGLNAPRRQATIGIQFFTGNGIVSCNTDTLRNIEIQNKIIVKIEIVNLDIKQILLRIQPVVAAAELR